MIISELEYRLQTVPRWGIVRTIQKQSVAEHSFYVALAADRIAAQYWGWTADCGAWRTLHRHALTHDQVEAITGDIPAIAKQYVQDDLTIFQDFESHVQEIPTIDDEIYNIVKAADLYETCRFLATEISMGNKSVIEIYSKCMAAFRYHMEQCGRGGIPARFMMDEISKCCEAQVRPMVAT